MRRLAPLWVSSLSVTLFLGACHRLLPFERHSSTDSSRDRFGFGMDALADGPNRERTPHVTDGIVCTTPRVLVSIADACLDPIVTTAASGTVPICKIGPNVGIFTFDVSTLTSPAPVKSFRFKLTYAAAGCGALCGSCESDQDGPLELYYMRSGWPEASVTWDYFDYHPFDPPLNTPWFKPGATELNKDRSAVVGSISHLAKQNEVFAISASTPIAKFDDWLLGSRISLQVTSPGGAFNAATRDQPSLGCPAYQKPTLEICQ